MRTSGSSLVTIDPLVFEEKKAQAYRPLQVIVWASVVSFSEYVEALVIVKVEPVDGSLF